MVTLSFEFDKDQIERAGITEEDLLRPMRNIARRDNIVELEYGVFGMEGSDALCIVSMAVLELDRADKRYIEYLKSWRLTTEDSSEDCVKEIRKLRERKIEIGA
ncbi:MAG: hypothetical protein J5825_05125 [Lachnospiraceae bacterium]|nr:hypothetical protein [Lachnospiraceae bacterium]